ncbi:LPXTG cell wall anchor domain-containing protein [Enterococcus alishanensis]
MNTQRKRKYWKGMLYSTTLIAMLGTPVSALAAVTQNIQSEKLANDQSESGELPQAYTDYVNAYNDYKTKKETYESYTTEENSLYAKAAEAKKIYEEQLTKLKEAEDEYLGLKGAYEEARGNYDDIEEQFNLLNKQYTEMTPEYKAAKDAYEGLIAPFEDAKSTLQTQEGQYLAALQKYNNLKASVAEGSDLQNAFQTAEAIYKIKLSDYKDAKKAYEKKQSDYKGLVTDYNKLLGEYQISQGRYQSNLSDYNGKKGLYEKALAEYNQALGEQAELNAKVAELNQTYQSSLAAYNSIKEGYEGEYDDLANLKDSYQVQMENYDRELSGLEGQIGEYNRQIAGYNQLRDGYLKTKQAYEDIVATYQSTTGKIEALLPVYEKNTADYNQAQAAYQKEAEAYNSDKRSYDENKLAYEKQLSAFETDAAIYAANRDAAQKILDQYAKGDAEYESAYAVYIENVKLYDQTVEKHKPVKAAYDQLVAEFTTTQTNYDKATESFTALENQYVSLKREYDNLNAQKQSAESSYETLKSNYQTASDQYSKVKNEHARIQKLLNELTTEKNRVSGLYDALVNSYNEINAKIPTNYPEVKAAYEKAKSDHGAAMAEYAIAKEKVKSLTGTKTNLEADILVLNTVLGELTTELGLLNTEMGEVKKAKTELEEQLEDHSDEYLIVHGQFTEVDNLFKEATRARDAVLDQVKIAEDELPIIEDQYEDLKIAHGKLTEQYNDAQAKYNKALSLYGPIEAQKEQLEELLTDLGNKINDPDGLKDKLDAANNYYENDLNDELEKANDLYQTALTEIESFNNDANAADMKQAYKAAEAAHKNMMDLQPAAILAIQQYNEDIESATGDITRAYEAAVAAMGVINETTFKPLMEFIDTYPINTEILINQTINQDTVDDDAQLAAYEDLVSELKTWWPEYQKVLVSSKEVFDEQIKIIKKYQTDYNAVLPEDKDPFDLTDFITDAEKLFVTTDTSDTNLTDLQAYLKVVARLKEYLVEFKIYHDKAEALITDDYEPYKKAKAFINATALTENGQPIAGKDYFDFTGLGIEGLGEVKTEDDWNNMLAKYASTRAEISADLEGWQDQMSIDGDAFMAVKIDFRADLDNIIEGTGVKFLKSSLPNNENNASAYIFPGLYKTAFEDNTQATLDSFNTCLANGLIRATSGLSEAEKEEIREDPFGYWETNYSWDEESPYTYFLLNDNFPSADPQITKALEGEPALRLNPQLKLTPMSVEQPTLAIPEPDALSPLSLPAELGSVEMEDLDTALSVPSVTDLKPEALPILPTVEDLSVKPVENIDITNEEVTPIDVTLPELETMTDVGKTELDVGDPGTNEDPKNADGTINEIPEPVLPPTFDESTAFDDVKKPDLFDPTPINQLKDPGEGVVLEGKKDYEITSSAEPVKITMIKPSEPTSIPQIDPPVIKPVKDPNKDPRDNRISGVQVTNNNLPSTSNKGTLPQTNDISNPWYQALGASIIGALGFSGWKKRKKAKADKD